MLGKIIGAALGSKLDSRDGQGGFKGALIGAAAPALIRRLGPLGLVIGGAIVAKKLVDGQRQRAAGY